MRRGFSLVEALIVAGILAAVGIPLLSLIQMGTREGALSEDFMFAEVVASRFLEEWASRPFATLDALVPHKVVTSAGGVIPERPHQETLATPKGFTGELVIARVKEGLLSLEITVTWEMAREKQPRKFALFLLKTDPAIALEARWKI